MLLALQHNLVLFEFIDHALLCAINELTKSLCILLFLQTFLLNSIEFILIHRVHLFILQSRLCSYFFDAWVLPAWRLRLAEEFELLIIDNVSVKVVSFLQFDS